MDGTKRALVIFDMDGTLFQAQGVTIPAVQETFAAFGLPVPEAEAIGAFIGRPAPEYHAWLASQCPADRIPSLIAATDRRELELIGEVGKVFPGVHSVLRQLRDAGCALAMSSNAPEDYFNAVLDTQDLRQYFQPALCRGTRFSGKAEIVGEILEQQRMRPFIVVGDREDDISSARAHGGYAIAVTYGFGNATELMDADALVECAADIPNALDRLLCTPCRRNGQMPG